MNKSISPIRLTPTGHQDDAAPQTTRSRRIRKPILASASGCNDRGARSDYDSRNGFPASANRQLPKDSAGFTLAELLIVIAIILVLTAIAIPVFGSSVASAKEATDLANCRSAKSAATTECLLSHNANFNDMTPDKWVSIALSAGVPEHGQVDSSAKLNCSISQDGKTIEFFYGEAGPDSGSGSSGGSSGTSGSETDSGAASTTKYPGTNLNVASSAYWPAQDEWASDQWKTVTINPGGIFQYADGNYYVVSKPLTMTKDQAASGPGGTVYDWYATQKITGRIITDWTDNSQKSDLQRGDMCESNGSYYVYVDGGSWGSNPATSPGQWYKLPA